MEDGSESAKEERESERMDDLWRSHKKWKAQARNTNAQVVRVRLEFLYVQLAICNLHAESHAPESQQEAINIAYKSLEENQEASLGENSSFESSIALQHFSLVVDGDDGPPVPIALLSALKFNKIILVTHSSKDEEHTDAFDPNDVRRLIHCYCTSLPKDQKSELQELDCFPKEPAPVAKNPATKKAVAKEPASFMSRMFAFANVLRSTESEKIAELENKIAELEKKNVELKACYRAEFMWKRDPAEREAMLKKAGMR